MKKIIVIMALCFVASCGSEQPEEGIDYTGAGGPLKCMPIESCSEDPLSLACSLNRSLCGCNGESQAQIGNKCE